MKKIGFILVTAGFLVASLAAVTNKEKIEWKFFIPALAVGVVGLIMIRVYNHLHQTSEEKITGHLADIESSIAAIAEKTSKLCTEIETIDPYHVRNRIDELFTAEIIKFVDARQAIARVYGLQEYADAMSYFASAERAINRAWSASTDGYKNEIKTSLQKANEYFGIVNEKIIKLKANR